MERFGKGNPFEKKPENYIETEAAVMASTGGINDDDAGEWEKDMEEIRKLYGQVQERANADEDFAKKLRKEREEINYFIHDLPAQFGNFRDYAAFHHLAGGTYNRELFPKIDMPGKYSIAKFYKRCLANNFPLQEYRTHWRDDLDDFI